MISNEANITCTKKARGHFDSTKGRSDKLEGLSEKRLMNTESFSKCNIFSYLNLRS